MPALHPTDALKEKKEKKYLAKSPGLVFASFCFTVLGSGSKDVVWWSARKTANAKKIPLIKSRSGLCKLFLWPSGNHTRENPAHTACGWAPRDVTQSCGGHVLLGGALCPTERGVPSWHLQDSVPRGL